MLIRAVVFDFDGLILDTESTDFQCWQEVYLAHDCDLPLDVWADCVGRPAGHFDPFAYLERLSRFPVDRERIRQERRTRLRELNLRQPVLPGARPGTWD